MPLACSLTRSRRARSSGGRSSGLPAPPRTSGSATRRSVPVATSRTHRQVTGSVPLLLRRNTTRPPPGDTRKARGTPRENRLVRACCLGKLSVIDTDHARYSRVSGAGVVDPQRVSLRVDQVPEPGGVSHVNLPVLKHAAPYASGRQGVMQPVMMCGLGKRGGVAADRQPGPADVARCLAPELLPALCGGRGKAEVPLPGLRAHSGRPGMIAGP